MLNISERQQAMLKEMGIDLPWADASPPPCTVADQAPQTAQPVQANAPKHIKQSEMAQSVPAAIHTEQNSGGRPPSYISATYLKNPDITNPPASQAQTISEPVPTTQPNVSDRVMAIDQMSWTELEAEVTSCTLCKLCKSRTQAVFGVGHQEAQIMIIGEAPGEQEDKQGQPFVGQAGKLLDRMLQALDLSRTTSQAERAVYIANVLKCRPPRNRNPELEEMALCEPFLKRQIELVAPKIIIAMGRFAVNALLGTHEAIGRLRSKVHYYQHIPVIVTYHPAYLLRNPVDKRKSWADLCLMTETLEQTVPE